MDEKDDDEIIDKVKIFSSDDKKLKQLGELLSNKSSRDIIKLLINNEMYTNEIADKLDLRVNLVIHHLKKLEDLGLLQIQNKTITKKGIEHKHYRINPYFFLAPSIVSEEIQSKGTLKKIFRDGIKFLVIGVAGVTSWFSAGVNNIEQVTESPSYSIIPSDNSTDIVNKTTDVIESDITYFIDPIISIPIIVVSCSLFLIWFSRKYK